MVMVMVVVKVQVGPHGVVFNTPQKTGKLASKIKMSKENENEKNGHKI
jgi:hypothetical protein